MNCPDICWINSTCPADGVPAVIVQAVNENGYIQLVNEPTRASNILDVVLTTDPLLVSELCVQCPVGNSDHCSVYFCLVYNIAHSAPESEEPVMVRDWRNADYDGISNYLSAVDWHLMISENLTSDSLWEAFNAELNVAVDQFVPMRCLRSSKSKRSARRYPRKSDRHRLGNDACRDSTERNHIMLSCTTDIGALLNKNGDLVTDDLTRANMLNDYFASVGQVDNGAAAPSDREVPPHVSLETVHFSAEKV